MMMRQRQMSAKSRERGVAIAEFPAAIPLAQQSRDYGAAVLDGGTQS